MKSLKLQSLLIPALLVMLMLLSPAWLVASTDGTQAVAKLKQMRASQNLETKLANMKANSIDVSSKKAESPALEFRQSLSAQKSHRLPDIQSSRTVDFHGITPVFDKWDGLDRSTEPVSSVIHGQGKMTYASPDSMYFNFLSGMNGIDTTGMDVGLAIGTGMMFGNDGSFVNDSSLVMFYSASAALDEISIVPTIDDPQMYWTGMSNEALVGKVYIVYTRTSKCYVKLLITSTSESYPDEHIAFDYMIQTNGSNDFSDTQTAVPPEISVNGREADTLLIGSEPYFSITMDQDRSGTLIVSWDQNHNGETDETDIPIDEYPFSDNDMHDLNRDDGIFEFIYDNQMADGLNYVINDFVYTVYTDDGMADAAVTYFTFPTPYPVSGTVRNSLTSDPMEGIVVWGDYARNDSMMVPTPEEQEGDHPSMIAITDIDGQYTLFMPDSGHVIIGSWDHLMVTDGLIPEPKRHEIELFTPMGDIDFTYREPLAQITGHVMDKDGSPLFDIGVSARFDGGGDDGGGDFFAYTDESGYYAIGVDPGWFRVELEGEDLYPGYMVPQDQGLEVTEAGPNTVDFTVWTPNSWISGFVLLDEMPLPGAGVWAWNMDFGWNFVQSDGMGFYEVPVFNPIMPTVEDFAATGYDLHVQLENLPSHVVQVSENWNVEPGTSNENIVLVTVTGGIYGTFFNTDNNEPIREPWNVGMEARNLDNGMSYWANPNEWDGGYELWLPNGLYEITAGGMNWYGPEPDTLVIDGSMMTYDIWLSPVQFEGIFEGRVWDLETQTIIANADVSIGNEFWGDWTMTDAEGRFSFNLPNGHYYYYVWAPGYLDFNGEVDINNNQVFHRIELQEFIVDGAITGMVFDDSSIPLGTGFERVAVVDANVWIYNSTLDIGFWTMTDSNGNYWFDLPNGIYEIYVEHPAYLPYEDYGLWVSSDTLYYDVPLATADGAISGRVYDDTNNEPIWDAGIWVTNKESMDSLNFMSYWTGVDDSGYFHIPLMNGSYEVHVDAYGYEHVYIADVFVEYNNVFLPIPMTKREFLGPNIHYIMDQPNDQGRWVRMEFGPDAENIQEYMAYSVWRLSQTQMGPMYDFIAYVPNKNLPFYNLVAPTLVDSNAFNAGESWRYETEFMVTGHYDNWNYIDGGPHRGWSVDNIHPGVPSGLTLIGAGDNYNELQWEASTDADFQYFELYRSETGDFTGLAPIAQLAELGYRDGNITTGQSYHYMLKAVDANGNVSDGSMVLTTIVSVEAGDQLPTEYSLDQNYPNPFNPSTTIRFGLPEAAYVTLDIYNILGQKVRTLTDSNMPAGYINITWDGLDQHGNIVSSGTYIYRLQTKDHRFAKKMIFMK
ncbi:MAG: carboxypeptidase regulatory-like domain-containing protein [Candidatus Marinimicrobia bacterium]|nr:carboxypeptidase regulatory-like domain-containing protein [Candidatus Neomarinimicrobiota bacterium]